jgi:hypothetical protein
MAGSKQVLLEASQEYNCCVMYKTHTQYVVMLRVSGRTYTYFYFTVEKCSAVLLVEDSCHVMWNPLL